MIILVFFIKTNLDGLPMFWMGHLQQGSDFEETVPLIVISQHMSSIS